jgi:hypothetical protein
MTYDDVKEQYTFDYGCRLDFFGYEIFTKKPVLIEVKNWFVSIKDMEQIMKYYIHALEMYGENKYALVIYAAGCELDRLRVLEKLGIEFYKIKDLVT